MKGKEAMHPGASWIDPDAPLTDLAERMRKEDIGAIPVGEDDRLIGMVSLGDVAAQASPSLASETLRAVSAHHA